MFFWGSEMLGDARTQSALKALLLLGLGLFLYTRLSSGTLYFYISERFGWLTFAAVLGLLVVGISYGLGRSDESHSHDETCHHPHPPGEHPAGDGHSGHSHSHALGWGGALIVALPILFGLLTPPRPLGANALAVRELSVSGLPSALPAAVQGATAKGDKERTVLDWVLAFQVGSASGERFSGREADVVGFVHRGQDDGADSFWLTR